MQIKKCRSCAQLVHIDVLYAQPCWNCGAFVDFALRENRVQIFFRVLDSSLTKWLTPFFDGERWIQWNRRALLTALPFAVLMLLICNSFQISVVKDATVPFKRLEIDFFGEREFQLPGFD